MSSVNNAAKATDVDIALLHAVRRDDLAQVQHLVEQENATVAARDSDGRTTLLIACYYGENNAEVVQYLVERCNANVEAIDVTGSTPLHWACLNGDRQIAQYLVEKCGADVNATDKCDRSCFHDACDGGNLAMVQYLVELGGDQVNVNATTYCGFTPLHLACRHGDLKIAQCLVESGRANVTDADEDGLTPLHWACLNGNLKMVQCLTKAIAAAYFDTRTLPNPQCGSGGDPRQDSFETGTSAVDDLFVTDRLGRMPLQMASERRPPTRWSRAVLDSTISSQHLLKEVPSSASTELRMRPLLDTCATI